jgi:hypothetical protein
VRLRTWKSGRRLEFALRLHPEDDLDGLGQQNMPIELVTDSATMQLEMEVGELHPDLLALAVLTIVAPWCRRRLTLDRGVSSESPQSCSRRWGWN